MSASTNYEELSLAQWESAGQIACFCVDPTTKEQAENFFTLFLEHPNFQLLLKLLQEGSNTLLFVLFSYLIKNPSVVCTSINNFEQMTSLISQWRLVGNNMIRSNQNIEGYVVRTIFTAFGYFLKGLCLGQANFRLTLNIVRRTSNIKFKLNLMKFFFEAMENKQSRITFLSHKLALSKYQAMAIPQIIDTVFPCFYSISEKMEVGELINLQGQLKMQQVVNVQSRKTQNYLQEQQDLMSLIFDLIKSLSQFPYNLTYSDFQGQEQSESKMILFPEAVIKKLTGKQFLQALFFIIEHAQQSNSRKIQKSVTIGIDCISKLLQGRLLDLSEIQRANVMVITVRRLVNILMAAQQKYYNIEVIQAIMSCSKKMFLIYDLKHIKQIIIQNTNSSSAYERFIDGLTSTILAIVSTEIIEFERKTIFDAVDLAVKILLNHGYSYTEIISPEQGYFMNFAQEVMNSFLNNLCSSKKSLFSCRGTVSMQQNKNILQAIFQGIKRISSYNYLTFFQLIEQKLNYLMNVNDFSAISTGLGNLFFLLSQVIERNYLQKTIFLNPLRINELILLSRITKSLTCLARQHAQRRNIYHKVNSDYYQLSILCFIESVIVDLLNSLKSYEFQRAHLRMHYYLINADYDIKYFTLQQYRQPIRQLIIEYERIVMYFLEGVEYPSEQQTIKMTAVLEIISVIVDEIKGAECELSRMNRIHFQSLIRQRYNEFIPYQMQRSKIFTIRSKLSLRQQCDSRKIKVQQYIRQFQRKPSDLLLYDILGTLEGISDQQMLIYFLRYLKRDVILDNLFWMNVQKAQGQRSNKLITDSVSLLRHVLTHRQAITDSQYIFYQFIQIHLPVLYRITEQILRSNEVDIDFWQGTLIELFNTFASILSSRNLNYFAFQYLKQGNQKIQINAQPLAKKFLLSVLRILDNILPKKIRIYPQLEQAALQFYALLTRHLIKYIFYDQSSAITHLYSSLHKKIVKLLIDYIEQKLKMTQQNEGNLQQCINNIKNLFFFVIDNKIQNQILIKNLQLLFTPISGQDEDINNTLGNYLITVLLSNNNFENFTWRSCGKCFYYLGKIRKDYIIDSLGKMKLSNQHNFRIYQAAEAIADVSEEEFLGMFKVIQKDIWSKQWK